MNFCTSCGQPGEAGARFCTSCGAPFAGTAADEAFPAQPEPQFSPPQPWEPLEGAPAPPPQQQEPPAQQQPPPAQQRGAWAPPQVTSDPQQDTWAPPEDAPTPPQGTWAPQQDMPPPQQEMGAAQQDTWGPQQDTWAPPQDTPPPPQGTWAPQQDTLASQDTWAPQQDTWAPQQDTVASRDTWAPQQEAWGAQPGAGFAARPGAQPGAHDDPFARFFRDGPGRPAGPHGGPAASPEPAYGGTMVGPPPFRESGPPAERPPQRSRVRAITLLVGVVVVLVAGGVGAWAALGGTGHPSAQAGQGTHHASTAPRSSPHSSASAHNTSPAPSPRSSGLVAAAPGVTGKRDERTVLAFLNRYFTAINTHDYQKYYALLDAQQQQQVTEGQFNSGYRDTRDSRATLVALGPAGGGTVAASITFTSHQPASDSPSHTSCTDWNTTLYLRPQGGSYLIGAPPASYRATFHAC